MQERKQQLYLSFNAGIVLAKGFCGFKFAFKASNHEGGVMFLLMQGVGDGAGEQKLWRSISAAVRGVGPRDLPTCGCSA